MMLHFRYGRVLISLAAILVAGCAPIIGVRVVRDDTWLRKLQSSALTSNAPSMPTTQLLRRHNLEAQLRRDLPRLIEQVHDLFEDQPRRDAAIALAELSYLEAKRRDVRSAEAAFYHATSMLFAYTYLFDEQLEPPPNEYDPTFRLACDLYNRSLAALVVYGDQVGANWSVGVRVPSLLGTVDVQPRNVELAWSPEDLIEFEPTFGYEVIGLTNHYRNPGIGVPLVVMRRTPNPANPHPGDAFLPRTHPSAAPATALVTIDCSLCAVPGGVIPAHVDLLDPLQRDHVEIAGRAVSLETDFTTPFAYMLSKHQPVQGLTLLLDPPKVDAIRGLYTLTPYQRGKIPVVFVHGLLSPAMKWLQMMNDLMGDAFIRERYQFWYFEYATGNPLLYSAMQLREAIKQARYEFDPASEDPALNEMVVVGNSMGGLLSRLCIQEGGDRLWNAVTELPIEQLELREEQKALLRRVFYFEPLPFVTRTIFMVTPHRGSQLADSALAQPFAKAIRYSQEVASVTGDLFDELRRRDPRLPRRRAGSGIDNLSPNNDILKVIGSTPLARNVIVHSIIADYRGEGRTDGTDLVVPYSSSHLDGVASERIIGGTHDSMTNPQAIHEVRRILLDHARGL